MKRPSKDKAPSAQGTVPTEQRSKWASQHVADLTSLRLRVKDIGGYWEARIGGGEKSVYLKSGGDITFVTDQKVEPLPPNYILENIEKPARS